MNHEEGLVGLQQGIEASLAIRFEILLVAKQQKAISLETLFAQVVELSLLFSAQVLDGLIDERHDVIAVKDDVHTGQRLEHGLVVGTAHVHGDTLESFSFSGELLQEGEDVFFAFSLCGMKDSSCSRSVTTVMYSCPFLMLNSSIPMQRTLWGDFGKCSTGVVQNRFFYPPQKSQSL
jgi:hypothetical protein